MLRSYFYILVFAALLSGLHFGAETLRASVSPSVEPIGRVDAAEAETVRGPAQLSDQGPAESAMGSVIAGSDVQAAEPEADLPELDLGRIAQPTGPDLLIEPIVEPIGAN